MPTQIISFACIFFNLNKYGIYVKIAELNSCGKYNLCTSVDCLVYEDKMYNACYKWVCGNINICMCGVVLSPDLIRHIYQHVCGTYITHTHTFANTSLKHTVQFEMLKILTDEVDTANQLNLNNSQVESEWIARISTQDTSN